MPTPNLKTATIVLGSLVLMMIPSVAITYFSPEEVIMNEDYFLPPTPRETQNRQSRQQDQSTSRRTSTQQSDFAEQHPAATIEASSASSSEAASSSSVMSLPEGISQRDYDLIQQLHIIQDRQIRRLLLGSGREGGEEAMQQTHQGAPLPPTGAGMWLAATVMTGAVFWTMRRARRAERDVL